VAERIHLALQPQLLSDAAWGIFEKHSTKDHQCWPLVPGEGKMRHVFQGCHPALYHLEPTVRVMMTGQGRPRPKQQMCHARQKGSCLESLRPPATHAKPDVGSCPTRKMKSQFSNAHTVGDALESRCPPIQAHSRGSPAWFACGHYFPEASVEKE
jgi:hypothetical protein